MNWLKRLTGVVAAGLVGLALWQLESARAGLEIVPLEAGTTPATLYRLPGATGPAVIIAHGFAGSRQLMEAFSLTLARAGYTAVSFDFEGHGRNPTPMSGDVTKIEGTTVKLLAQLTEVIDAVLAQPGISGPVALLGHSMASDIVIRQAIADERVAAVVAVSMYSEAPNALEPRALLMVTGAWEPGLRAVALEVLRQVDPTAQEDETASGDDGVRRRASVAARVEHLGVLYSRTSLQEARAWLDEAFGRASQAPLAATGGWISLLLGAVLLLAWPLAGLLPRAETRPETPDRLSFLAATLLPALLTPLLLAPLDLQVLPVLVADYLLLHLLVYGAIALAVWRWRGLHFGPLAPLPGLALLVYGLGAFGLALDRYAASFVPHEGRLTIVLAVALGALPFMVADALVTEAGRAALWRRLVARLAFFASLGLAVALDFERLFFLVLILPVIALFFLVFGSMGGWVGRRCGAPLAPGLALGLILAWSIGVSFPLVAVGAG